MRGILALCLACFSFPLLAEAQTAQTVQPEIPGVIRAGAKAELIKGGFHGLEGPVGLPDGELYFSDITENRSYKLDKAGGISAWRENTQGANGEFLLKDGRIITAGAGRQANRRRLSRWQGYSAGHELEWKAAPAAERRH